MTQLRDGLRPFSPRDLTLSALFIALVVGIWFAGDFHAGHDTDSIIHSLNSLYRWTIFVWEYDHVGSLLSLLTRFITRPYWNLMAVSTISALLFFSGLAFWATRLVPLTLSEACLWTGLLVPVILTKRAIFQLASHSVSSGAALFFSAAYVFLLQKTIDSPQGADWRRAALPLFATAFLAVYLSKIALFPLAAVTAGLFWTEHRTRWRQMVMIGGSLVLAFACYELLEWNSPFKKDYTLSLEILPKALPSLLANWGQRAVTGILWIVAPALLLLNRIVRQHSVFAFLAAGIATQILVVASSRWAAANGYASHYLSDLSFLSLMAVLILAADLLRRVKQPQLRAGVLSSVGVAAIFLNMMEWRAYRPADPIGRIEHWLGGKTTALAAADCDLIVGSYWNAWPAMFALNDYYARNDILDPHTGQARRVYAISYLAASTEDLWRPRLDQPGANLCSLAIDEPGYQNYLRLYAPELAYRTTPAYQVDGVLVHRIDVGRPPDVLVLDFDSYVPGSGWSFPEESPAGDTFIWTTANTFTLLLPISTASDLELDFRVYIAMAPEILESLALSINDRSVDLKSERDHTGAAIIHTTISRSILPTDSAYVELVFTTSHTLVPMSTLPNSDDSRALGLAFDWLRLRPRSQP